MLAILRHLDSRLFFEPIQTVERRKIQSESELKEKSSGSGAQRSEAEGLEKHYVWSFSQRLNSRAFIPLIQALAYDHLKLVIEYNLLCAEEIENKALNIERVTLALMLAETLVHIYSDYLPLPQEAERFYADLRRYQAFLMEQGVEFGEECPQTWLKSLYPHSGIRSEIPEWNWRRLTSIRTKNLLVKMTALMDLEAALPRFILAVEAYTKPAITYLAWLFFLPRLTSNLLLLLELCFKDANHPPKHDVVGEQFQSLGLEDPVLRMDLGGPEAQAEVISWGVLKALQAQWAFAWFETGNDGLWFLAGIINCFILIGALAPTAAYVNLFFFLYDAIAAYIRYSLELNRYAELSAYYKTLGKELSPLEAEELAAYEKVLKENLAFEEKRLFLAVKANTVLFLAAILCLPVLGAYPLIPILGAVAAVLATVLPYFKVRDYAETLRPKNTLNDLLSSKGFFSPGSFTKSMPKEDTKSMYREDDMEFSS